MPAVVDFAAALADEGIRAEAAVVEIADADAVAAAFAGLEKSLGPVDILVNNAGFSQQPTLERTTPESWKADVDGNLNGTYYCTHAVLPSMKERRAGAIVNIGSVNGLSGEPNLLAYSVAKGGLITLTRNLANALATEKIRVNQLNVGWVTTPNEITLKQREGLPEGWEKNVPPAYAPTGDASDGSSGELRAAGRFLSIRIALHSVFPMAMFEGKVEVEKGDLLGDPGTVLTLEGVLGLGGEGDYPWWLLIRRSAVFSGDVTSAKAESWSDLKRRFR